MTDNVTGIIETAAAFTRDRVAPEAAGWERARRVPVEAIRDAAARGLCGLMVPAAHGGAGYGMSTAARVFEELAVGCMAFAFSLEVQNNLARSVASFGTAGQIARHLPPLLSGARIGAFLLTEPGVGSDAAAITTRATRDGDGWVIDGEKAWVTNGTVAETLFVFAQTDRDAGWRGIAAFVIDATADGVTRGAAYSLLGGHAMGVGGFTFSAVRVAGDALLIGPGEAFKEALHGIDVARVGVGALCCGMMRSGLATALDYAARRQAFGRPTIEFQGLQWMLADVATDLEAARLLTREAALAVDAGGGTVAAAHAKKFATRAALKGLADCMQAMGAAGLKDDTPLARHLACAKTAQFLDGTTEIQNVVIARDLMRRGGGT